MVHNKEIEAVYPLSPMQQGMLFHSLYNPEVSVYFEQLTCTFVGPLDTEAFRRAVERVVSRHAVLRTSFVWKRLEKMLQVVHAGVVVPVAVEDWRSFSAEEQNRRLEAYCQTEMKRGFNLSKAPLVRIALLRLQEHEYKLVWSHHHLLLDGWSFPLVVQEVLAFYEAFAAGKELHLPLPRPFREYIAWLQQQDLGRAERFWREKLAGFVNPTPLGVDALAGGASGAEGYAKESLRLPTTATTALQAFAQRHRVTLNTVIHAAWALLLHRYSGESDVVFGATVSGRPSELPGSDRMVGLFINTLPVRVQLRPGMVLRELLEILQAAQGELREFEYTPLVQIQSWSGVPNDHPLFQSIIVFENYPVDATLSGRKGSLSIRDLRSFERTNYPLTVVAAPGQELPLEIAYEVQLFDPSTIRRMLVHLRTLLEAFVTTSSETAVTAIPVLDSAEQRDILRYARGEEWAAVRGHVVPRLFEAQVERSPSAVAVRCGDEEITYRELNRRATVLSHELRRLNVGPDVLVGICLGRSIEMIVGMLGVLKAGGAYVPLDPHYPAARLATMVQDSGLRLLVTQRSIADSLSAMGVPAVFLEPGGPEGNEVEEDISAEPLHPENLAYVIYTSGSTGIPKGVAVCHDGLVNHAASMVRLFGLGEGSRVLQFLSFNFDASGEEIFPALLSGATLIIHPAPMEVEGKGLVEFLYRERITVMHLPVSLWHHWVGDIAAADLGVPGSLQWLVVGGESPSGEKLGLWMSMTGGRVRFVNAYGPTEATIAATVHVRGEAAEGLIPIGRPLQNVAVYVLDSRLCPVPIGVPGELYIGGAGVARGYLARPDLTAEKFVPDPFAETPGSRFYKTGDRVRLLPEGNLQFLGRVDEQVKIRGFRIEPGEIEARLREHPAVRDAVVTVREDQTGEKVLVAYVIPEGKPEPETAVLLGYLRERLPDYMVPSMLVFMEAVPLTATGKVNRAGLPDPWEGGARRAEEFVSLRTATEELLAGLWATILGGNGFGGRDNFFHRGGHSLRVTQLLSRIRDVFGVELPLRDVFEHPQLADLARQIDRARNGNADTEQIALEAVPRSGPLPLSYAQQRLWFLDQLSPGGSFYNIPTAFRLTGVLDRDALEKSLREIVHRHEVLRTTFVSEGGTPAQRIAESLDCVVLLQDLTAFPETEREERLIRLVREEARRPFDLATGPLFRSVLFALGADHHVFQLTVHHIIADGWSMGVLVREFVSLYHTFAEKQEPSLPPLEFQYADFAHWQRRWLQGEVLDRQLTFWKDRLAGIPALLELPTDRPRPAVQTFQGGTRSIVLPGTLVGGLSELSRREGATLFMTLLAAFQTLLHRYSGQDDVLVGSPVANRTRSETEKLIGFFVNTLVLRARFDTDPTFRELLRQVREFCLGAFAHQDIPFERLVEEVQPSRDLSHSPLFQVAFVLQNMPMTALELPDVVLSPIAFENPTAKYDLTMTVVPDPSGLQVHLEYNSDLFEAATVDRMLAHFRTILESMAAEPGQRVSDAPLMKEAELDRVLHLWNRTEAMYPSDLCVHEWFEREVQDHPDAVAVTLASEELTYECLNRRANQLARRLRSLGVGTESIVGICMERSMEMVIGILGTLKAGGAFLPLDPAYPLERLRYMIEDSGLEVMLTQHSVLERIPETTAQIVVVDRDWLSIVAENDSDLPSLTSPENLAYVIYTSGSTGMPKGAMLRHRGLCNLATAQIAAFTVGEGSRILQFSSLSFDASVWETVMALLSGAALCLAHRDMLVPGPGLLEVFRGDRITTATLPPSVLAVLPHDELPDLRTIITAGEKCTAELVQHWGPGRQFFNAYGPTETTVCASMMLVERHYPQGPPIGRPITNTRIYLLDRKLNPVPVGVPGELHVAGVSLARGYLRRPDVTAERFIPDPFATQPGGRLYKTGDLARYLPDGTIEFLGRIDYQVKVRGFRIELGEIEATLVAHPQVRDAVAIVREDHPGDRRVVAYVVPEEESGLTGGDVRQHLRARVPDYMVPSALVLLDAMPLTPNGKVDRKALPVPDLSRREAGQEYVAPTTPTEGQLAEICARLLGLEKVGIHDNFFEIGGHSLLATQLLSRVRETFRVDMPLRTLFESPTVADVGRRIDELLTTPGEVTVSEIQPQSRGEQSLEQMLQELADLSDEQVRTLLEEEQKGPTGKGGDV